MIVIEIFERGSTVAHAAASGSRIDTHDDHSRHYNIAMRLVSCAPSPATAPLARSAFGPLKTTCLPISASRFDRYNLLKPLHPRRSPHTIDLPQTRTRAAALNPIATAAPPHVPQRGFLPGGFRDAGPRRARPHQFIEGRHPKPFT